MAAITAGFGSPLNGGVHAMMRGTPATFAVATDMADNALATLDLISQFVEILDRYFGNVCEVRASVIDDHLSMHVCLT